MKKLIFTLIAITMSSISSISMAAMSTNKVRQETRFLTDKMAYELNLSTEQYNDVYEINYDFIYNIRYIIDDVVYEESWALDDYYYYLDMRNDDLRWVLSDWQYERFLNIDYFYRPIYSSGYSWGFRIYLTYRDPGFFYFGKPYHYKSYHGGHFRSHYNDRSFYMNRYSHNVYRGNFQTRDVNVYNNNRRSDFGRTSPVYKNMNVTPNRESRGRKFNDDLYNTGRNSESQRGRTSTGVNRSTENNRGTVRGSSDREKEKSGKERENIRKEREDTRNERREINKERENNRQEIKRERDTNQGGERRRDRTPNNESYFINSDNGTYNNNSSAERNRYSNRGSENAERRSEARPSVSSERESSYNRSTASTPAVRSNNSGRSYEYVRSSSENRAPANVQRSNSESRSSVSSSRSYSESRQASPAPSTRSSDNDRSSVRSSSSEQSRSANNDNSRSSSSESSRSRDSWSRR